MRYLTVCLLCLVLAPAGQARIEITPFGGHQGGGEFDDHGSDPELEIQDDSIYGVMLGFGREESSTQLELYFSRQETQMEETDAFSSTRLFDLDVDYYHIGGVFHLQQGNLQPYIVGSLGATRFDSESSNLDSDLRFSLGLGVGLKWFPMERVGVRIEGRLFGTFVDTESVAYSGPNGTVAVGRTEFLGQYNAVAGLIFVIP